MRKESRKPYPIWVRRSSNNMKWSNLVCLNFVRFCLGRLLRSTFKFDVQNHAQCKILVLSNSMIQRIACCKHWVINNKPKTTSRKCESTRENFMFTIFIVSLFIFTTTKMIFQKYIYPIKSEIQKEITLSSSHYLQYSATGFNLKDFLICPTHFAGLTFTKPIPFLKHFNNGFQFAFNY